MHKMPVRVVLASMAVLVVAQPSAQEPSFEVASVKVTPDRSGGGFTILPTASGRVRFDGAALETILSVAFNVPLQMAHMRLAWTRATEGFKYTPGFEILATASPGGDQRAMLRTLLAERFGLRVHREMRPTAVLRLVVKEPGKLGPRLAPSPHNCRADRTPAVCRPQPGVRRSAGTIQDFIETVAVAATLGERPVVDATGLTGNFEWTFAEPRVKNMELDEMFEAFENQLGLKLERATVPWEVIVIDALHLPTAN